jgi:hypothetical protein
VNIAKLPDGLLGLESRGSFGGKDFALRFVRWGRCPMTIDDYIVGSILIVIVLWVLVKMRPRGKS